MRLTIEVTGHRETSALLAGFGPLVKRRASEVLGRRLNRVALGALARYPRGSWRARVDAARFYGSVAATGGAVSRQGWGVSGPGVRAEIFEFLGASSSGSRPQVRATIASLNARYGSPGRFLWAAWDAAGRDVEVEIAGGVRAAEQELQRQLNSVGR